MESQHAPGIGDYLLAIRRRRRLLLGIAVPIIAFSVVLAVALPDIYRSTGLFEIVTDKAAAPLPAESTESGYADQYISRLKGSVLGDSSLQRLLAEHELYPGAQGSSAEKLLRLRNDIDVEIVTEPILDPRTGRQREVVAAFSVAYENRSPELALLGATWLVDEFQNASRVNYQQRAASAAQFYANEADRVGTQIAQLESTLAEFKDRNIGRLPDLAESNIISLERTDRDLEAIRQQGRALRQERVYLVAQLSEAQRMTQGGSNLRSLEEEYLRKSAQYDESHPDMIALRRQIENLRQGGSAVGSSLTAQLAAQRSILAEARQRYSPEHPDVKRISRNIGALQARIASGEPSADSPVMTPAALQVQAQINSIDAQLASLGGHGAELRARLEKVQGLVAAAPEVEREYKAVTRDIDIARAQYDELLKLKMDSEVAVAAIADGRADEFRLSKSPTTPVEPAKPMRLAIALIGTVLALIIALTGTALAIGLDRTVRGALDVRAVLGVSPLVTVPDIRNSASRRQGFGRALAQGAGLAVVVLGFYVIILAWTAT